MRTSTDSAAARAATAGPTTKIQSAGMEYGYPHGHLGHLTHEEELLFAKFKDSLQQKGLYKPGPPPSHDDATLLRFLRARRWVIEDAYKQFKDTEEWRHALNLDVLYDTIDVEAYEQSRRLYPQWTGRRDKRGIPVYLFEIRHLDSKTISAYEKSVGNTYSKAAHDGKTPARLIRLFALYENLTRFAQPLCSQVTAREHPRTPITLSTNIVDVSGVSLRQFWNLKGHMQAASQLATAHYPETLDRIFILGAPIFFTTVWGWIKRWFDPVTVSKIFILSHHEVLPVLSSFIHRANIPRQYGGDLDFAWGDSPNLDPAVRDITAWEDGFDDFPRGPLYWRPLPGGRRLECVAVGSVEQRERCVRVCTIPRAYPDGGDGSALDSVGAGEGGPVMNGHAVVGAGGGGSSSALEEASSGLPSSSSSAAPAPARSGEAAPIVTDRKKEAVVPAVTGAPVEPAAQPQENVPPAEEPRAAEPLIAETQGVQNLSLLEKRGRQDDEESVSEKMGESMTIPNGKALVAA